MISIIAAAAKNRTIGRHGRIPWHLPEDMAHFRRLTMGHTLILGRITYEGIGAPLPGRRIIVISADFCAPVPGIRVASSLEEAVALAEAEHDPEIFLGGGQRIYEEGLHIADRIYLTELDEAYEGDVFFPKFEGFALRERRRAESAPCDFCLYEREL